MALPRIVVRGKEIILLSGFKDEVRGAVRSNQAQVIFAPTHTFCPLGDCLPFLTR
jgi:hypothetical protein